MAQSLRLACDTEEERDVPCWAGLGLALCIPSATGKSREPHSLAGSKHQACKGFSNGRILEEQPRWGFLLLTLYDSHILPSGYHLTDSARLSVNLLNRLSLDLTPLLPEAHKIQNKETDHSP